MHQLGTSAYKQGQEYFYYVNHQGFLFLDDSRMKNFTAAYKDVQFLNFFYKMLKINKTERYKEFPFISPCGIERNYLRCDDTPIVYTELDDKQDLLKIGQSTLFHNFEPKHLWMTENGRVYHKCSDGTKYGQRVLIADKLTDRIYNKFEFGNDGKFPIAFLWKGERVLLENEFLK